jgi:hypothetical protein
LQRRGESGDLAHDATVKQQPSELCEIKWAVDATHMDLGSQVRASSERSTAAAALLARCQLARTGEAGGVSIAIVAESTKTETAADGEAQRDKASNSGVGTTHAP